MQAALNEEAPWLEGASPVNKEVRLLLRSVVSLGCNPTVLQAACKDEGNPVDNR